MRVQHVTREVIAADNWHRFEHSAPTSETVPVILNRVQEDLKSRPQALRSSKSRPGGGGPNKNNNRFLPTPWECFAGLLGLEGGDYLYDQYSGRESFSRKQDRRRIRDQQETDVAESLKAPVTDADEAEIEFQVRQLHNKRGKNVLFYMLTAPLVRASIPGLVRIISRTFFGGR